MKKIVIIKELLKDKVFSNDAWDHILTQDNDDLDEIIESNDETESENEDVEEDEQEVTVKQKNDKKKESHDDMISKIDNLKALIKEIDKETFKIITKLVDLLESDDDVSKVYHNVQYDDSFAE
jgi:transcriptional/translational regulatory protein YebC/TACO1